ncbi:conserved hypothetical protein [Cupriavidus taiwanensis]|nr:conserved hypothetical protein [Cupriavidus taiwanensis]SOY91574.1 conserved hypothetical protein [Cupriavidus taiwanensis]
MVTSWPASGSEMARPAPICGSSPAGKASVRTVMKPATANASSAGSGSRAGCAPCCASFASVLVAVVMVDALRGWLRGSGGDTVDRVAQVGDKAAGHAFVQRVGERHHAQSLAAVDEPGVAVGPAPAPGAGGFRGTRPARIAQHREAQSEAGSRRIGQVQAAGLVARHVLDQRTGQQRAAALAQGLQQAQEVLRRARHAGAAGREGPRIEDAGGAVGNANRACDHGHEFAFAQAVRVRVVVHVRGRHAARIACHEAGVGHAQRAGDQLPHGGVERRAMDALDQRAQHVGRERVAPCAARLVQQGHAGDAPQVLGQADGGVVHAVGDAGAGIGSVCAGLEEAIAQPRGMAEQLPRGDTRRSAIGQARAEFGQPTVDILVKIKTALCQQHHCRHGDDRLAYRSQPEDGIAAHGLSAFAIGQARRLLVDQFAVTADQHDGADQSPLFQRLPDHGVDALIQGGYMGHNWARCNRGEGHGEILVQ